MDTEQNITLGDNKAGQALAAMLEADKPANIEENAPATPDSEKPADSKENAPATLEADKPADSNNELEHDDDAPFLLTDLAESLELEQGDLYEASLAMPGNAEPRTIGELKDFYVENSGKIEDLNTLEEQKLNLRTEVIKTQKQIDAIVKSLPREVLTPEYQEAVTGFMQERGRQENEKLLNAMPEWANEPTFHKDRDAMTATLQEFGFDASELGLIQDHRYILMLNAFSQLKAKQSLAAIEAKKTLKQGSKKSKLDQKSAANAKKQGAKQRLNAAKNGSKRQKAALVGEIFQN